jgi:uncharacterized protein YndB with AHSA1/START domain
MSATDTTFSANRDKPSDFEWRLWKEFRCRRETVWQALAQPEAWRELWGDCEIDLRPAGRFADNSGDVMLHSFGEFAQVIAYRRFDLYWYLGRPNSRTPEKLNRANCVWLAFEINQTAPSVQCVSVRARWEEGAYPSRGQWVGLAQEKWSCFLDQLEAKCKKMTSM